MLNQSRSLLLLTLTLFLTSQPAFAGPKKKWPGSVSRVCQIYTLNGQPGFAELDGAEPVAQDHEDFSSYSFLEPDGKANWNKNVRWRRGVLHTNRLTMDEDQNVQVAVPIRFCLTSDFIDIKKGKVLSTQLLSVSVLTLDKKECTFSPVPDSKAECYSLNDLYLKSDAKGKDDSQQPLCFEFEGILVGKALKIPKDLDYSVRVEWCGEQITGEKNIEFGIGDQIRLLTQKDESKLDEK